MNVNVNIGPPDDVVVSRLDDFDRNSGSLVERLLFNNRAIVLGICVIVTMLLGWQARKIEVNASFERMIPTEHPYIVNYLAHADDLRQQGNLLRVVVAARDGTILNPGYLATLQQLNQDLSGLPGVDVGNMSSLWSPDARWVAVTEDGFTADTIIPQAFTATPEQLALVRRNIELSGQIGRMVAPDFGSSIITVPLRETVDATGTKLNYGALAREVDALRAKYAAQGVDVRVTGFAMVVGDMINANDRMLVFFGLSIAIAALFLYGYTRCVSSTLLVVVCSLVAVLWQVGLVALFGQALDPYSVLVPFLIYAIGMSHGAQKMNGVMQDIGRGMPRQIAARMTFRRLFMAGFAALVCDAVGFVVLYIIHIDAIRTLALIASAGVAILIFTNLILLPILLSFLGVSRKGAARALEAERRAMNDSHRLWDLLVSLTRRRQASVVLAVALVLAGGAMVVRQNLAIGDLDRGAPELRQGSVYNQDNLYLTTHYGTSSDVFVVMADMASGKCNDYAILRAIDTLDWKARQLPGVSAVTSLSSAARMLIVGTNEQNFHWYELIENQSTLNDIAQLGMLSLTNSSCSLDPISIYLDDHKAATLQPLSGRLERFIAENRNPDVTFKLAAGNAGIEAATNAVVGDAVHTMLYWVYGAVAILSLIAFRSWRAVICAILPLMLTSILAESLMVVLGIGVKVATLPVVALGVGIGVDYALYVLSIVLKMQRAGETLERAYRLSLMFTGRVVLLTGVTLATGVGTWAFAPIKFQADMGILLAFMFIWNMVGALVLLPALASFLLRGPARAA